MALYLPAFIIGIVLGAAKNRFSAVDRQIEPRTARFWSHIFAAGCTKAQQKSCSFGFRRVRPLWENWRVRILNHKIESSTS